MALRDRRLSMGILLCGMGLALSVLAWPWLRANLVGPVTLVVWLLLRVLVLSIHQSVYWTALICAVPILLLAMLRRRAVGAWPPGPVARSVRADPVETWRYLVEQTAGGGRALPFIGWNGFVRLAVTLRAIERRAAADYLLHDALRTGRDPLPEHLRVFLFPADHPLPRGRAAHPLRWIAGAARRALRRVSGRDRAERLRSISQLLSFLEDSLEMPSHDDDHDRTQR